MADLQAIDDQLDGFAILGHGGALYGGCGVIHLGATVFGLKDIGVSLHAIGRNVPSGLGINGFGKLQLKPVGLDSHFENLKGCLAGPYNAIKSKALASAGSPPSVGTTRIHGTVGTLDERNVARTETFTKGKASALVISLYLLEETTVDHAMGLVRNKKLLLERPEFASRIVTGYAAG